jgi:parallel beta-helix repeat protein
VLLAWIAPALASDIGHEVADQVSLASYQHYLDDLLYTHNGNNRNALTGPDKGPARANIVATLESFGLEVELEPFTYQGTTCYNVIATQLGTVYPDAYYVIGAHYDSKGNPGADDNASGVAGVLEIARILSAYESEYTIKYMAFDAEEYGLIGSDYYVDNHYYDDIRGMISMDMIAYNQSTRIAEVWGSTAYESFKLLLRDAILMYGNGLSVQLPTGGSGGSDHMPFADAGFQACLLIEDNPTWNPCYHKACDSVDTANYINYTYACDMTRSVAGFLADNALVSYPIDCQTGQGCELTIEHDQDCNANGVWDYCDIRCGTSEDANVNRIPDECEPHQTWYVNCANCPGPGSGSQADPFCKIQDAINAAASGVSIVVEIIVADGTYTGAGNKDLDFGGKGLTLRSANGPTNCVIDCQGSGRGFYFHSGETAAARVDGFTIRNGNVTSSSPGGAKGGGVYCSSASPTLVNCTIDANAVYGSDWASGGGGVFCYSSSPMLTNCTITGNTACGSTYGRGGGVYCYSSSPMLTNCTITGNTASGISSGGGVYCYYYSSPRLTNCTISGNTAGVSSSGGGVYCYYYSSPRLTNCTITGNTASGSSFGYGGGVYCSGSSSSPRLTNCTISQNSATYRGGGVYCDSSSPMLTNCTISQNSATYLGGGVYCTSTSSKPVISNCILWADTPQEIYVYSGTPVVTYSDVQGGWTGTGNLNTDPLFVDAAGGDYHLAGNSPCIDAGNPASDYSLEPEPDGGRINMGAYGNTAEAESKGWLYVQGYNLVEKTRVGRTLFDYRLQVRVKNQSASNAVDVSLELLHMPSNVTIIEPLVDVGSVPAGATVTSTDTFTIRVDRQTLTSALGISWRVTYAIGGVTEDRTFAGSLGRETLEPSHIPAVPEPLPPQESAGGAARPANVATRPG